MYDAAQAPRKMSVSVKLLSFHAKCPYPVLPLIGISMLILGYIPFPLWLS